MIPSVTLPINGVTEGTVKHNTNEFPCVKGARIRIPLPGTSTPVKDCVICYDPNLQANNAISPQKMMESDSQLNWQTIIRETGRRGINTKRGNQRPARYNLGNRLAKITNMWTHLLIIDVWHKNTLCLQQQNSKVSEFCRNKQPSKLDCYTENIALQTTLSMVGVTIKLRLGCVFVWVFVCVWTHTH